MSAASPVAAPLAIYGGAFDPFHLAHLALALRVRDALDADVRLIPTGDPRHRDPARTTAQHRIAMLRLAIANEPRLAIDTREIERIGASYSIDTLIELREEQGSQTPLLLTMGSDSFSGLPSWHRWRELLELAHIVVALRPEAALEGLPEVLAQVLAQHRSDDAQVLKRQPAGSLFLLPMPPHFQSSSAIRARIAAGKSLHGWVPPAVARYIREHALYG